MWGLLIFVIGLLYGWLTPGRQDKSRLFVNGLLIGLVVAVVLALLGWAVGAAAIPLGAGFVGVFLSILILTGLFVLGAWLGDLLEGARGRTRQRTV